MATQQQINGISVATLYTWSVYYNTIIIVNSSATVGLYVRVDGVAAVNTVGAAGQSYINAVSVQEFENGLPIMTPGQLIPGTLAEGNLTVTSFLANFADTTHPTQVWICPVASGPGTGEVIVQ
jgi:hypothetical protein